jgi:hypothetical protein
MKALKISLLVVALGLMSFTTPIVSENGIATIVSAGTISWKSDTIEVGSIPQGTPKVIEFEFKNNSDKSVILTNVKPACGCTAADYSKEPIAPGKSGYVKATYNAAALGSFVKTVTVTTNLEETPITLTFKGTVVAKS